MQLKQRYYLAGVHSVYVHPHEQEVPFHAEVEAQVIKKI